VHELDRDVLSVRSGGAVAEGQQPPARKRRDISWQASASRGASALKKDSKILLRRNSSSRLRITSESSFTGRIIL
jgi:hypothetical protein